MDDEIEDGLLHLIFIACHPGCLNGVFQDVFFRSRWVFSVDAIEFSGGALLIANRFVPLALTLLGGVSFNIIAFHVTLAPTGLPIASIIALLWRPVVSRHRSNVAPLFTPKPVEKSNVVSSVLRYHQEKDWEVA